MEALIVADGSRPSFALQNGRYDPADPFIGNWLGQLNATGNTMAGIARAVGRIQPENGSAVEEPSHAMPVVADENSTPVGGYCEASSFTVRNEG